MKAFLRENPTIAFGLGLPLLLVIVFLLVSGIPSLLVASPKHDVVYATDNYYSQGIIQISVVEQKVQVTYLDGLQHNTYPNQRPRLWRYIASTGAVKEIGIKLPASANNNTAAEQKDAKSIEIVIPELADLTFEAASIAPDGYEFDAGRDRYSGNVFGGLFYSHRYRHQAILTKDGRSIRLPNTDQSYRGSTQFIGWVVAE